MPEELQDVVSAPDTAATTAGESSPPSETSVNSQAGVNSTDAAISTAVETQEEADPLAGVPTLEELQAQAGQKIPYAQALAQLRPAYENLKTQVDSYKPLESWKEIATTIGDPALAQSAHQLVSAIHTPAPENPTGFTSRPFLEQLETESPGSVDQIFADTLGFQVPDVITGQPSTVVRNLFKSFGLDPDRVEDYRKIDALGRASGVVTAEDIGKIPEKYHDAFRSLSATTREDLLAMQETNPAAMEEYLRNANDALEARSWREKDELSKKQAQEQQEAQWREQVQTAIYSDLETESTGIGDSILQNLSSQFTFSSDAAINELEITKVLSVLGNLQSSIPFYQNLGLKALKAAGVEPTGFAETLNRWEERRIAYKQFEAMGDKLQAKRALSEATVAKQQILAKANDYALRLAAKTGERAAAQAAQTGTQLAAATARFVPNGNGGQQNQNQNPYSNNPHPIGSQEYFAHNRKIDREYSLTNASAYGG